METLEIQVFDSISTFDTLVGAVEFIVEQIKKWFSASGDKPLNISIRKMGNKAPPTLNISVNDAVSAKGGLV